MPMSAAFSAGASFTPSPVTATTSPLRLQRLDDAHLLLGGDAGEEDLRRVERELQLDVGHARAARSPVITTGSAPRDQADLAGDGQRRVRVVAGDHDHLDARRRGSARAPPALPAAAGLRGRRARQRSGRALAPALRRSASSRQAKASTRRPSLGHRVLRRRARRVAPRRSSGASPSDRRCGRTAAARPPARPCSTASAARRRCVHDRHRLRSESNGISSTRVSAAELAGIRPAELDQRDLHRIAEPARRSPLRLPPSSCGSSARTRQQARSRAATRASVGRRRRQSTAENSRCTDMRFWVSVPVLSVQMTVVEPSVSTAGRWRTSALRRAMRCVAIASDSVTVGSSPSGTLATMMPMANRGCPRTAGRSAWPMKKNTHAEHRARRRPCGDRRAISRCSGERLAGRLGEVGDLAELGAHARSRRPAPAPRRRPAKCRRAATLRAAASAALRQGRASRAGQRLAGDRRRCSTRTPKASISRQSAGTWSPASSSTTSPGTSSSAGKSATAAVAQHLDLRAAAAAAGPQRLARPGTPARRRTRR